MLATRARMAAAGVAVGGGDWWDDLTSPEGAWEGALASDQTDSYIDRTGNGNTLVAHGGTVDWTTLVGWSGFAANNSVLFTGIFAPDEDKAMMVQFADVTNSTTRCIMGCSSPLAGNTAFAIYPVSYNSSTKRLYLTQGAEADINGQQATATMALCGGQPYLNGAPDGSAISTGTGTTSPIGIGAGVRRIPPQDTFAGDAFCDGTVLRAVVWLRVPSDAEILALHDAWMLL